MEEDMRGRGIRKRTFGNLGGRKNIWRLGTVCVCWFDIFWFGSLGGLLQGCTRLLGVLGSGARNPHGILELGSRTGSVPSWQGGRFGFGQSFGSREDNRRLGISIRQRYVF
jgi:hypothetical protein